MPRIREKKREQYSITIGPLLKNLLNRQKEIIKQATYDCIESSDYEAGEIIAKKMKDSL